MLSLREKASKLLDAFYKATGIGALCFDSQLNLIAYNPQCDIADDFLCLGAHELTSFLVEKFDGATKDMRTDTLFTYYFEANLVSNVSLIHHGSSIGAFITQPVFVNKMTQVERSRFLSVMARTLEERRKLERLLGRIPFIPNGKVMPIGVMLSSLAQTLSSGIDLHQEISGTEGTDKPFFREFGMVLADDSSYKYGLIAKHGSFEDYTSLKESIQSGDRQALKDLFSKNNAGAIEINGDSGVSFTRSLKNYVIKICSLSCFMAIEAGVPYYKAMETSDQYIGRAEQLTNANELYNLMEEALVSFTRAVAVSRVTSYSKSIRQVIDYIESRYAEKITLKALAEHTRLSTTYLSSLIKKETGLSLLDNINKVRIDRSKNLLLDTSLSNSEVAKRVGFNYQNHFSTIFKKLMGVSPSEYRRSVVNDEDRQNQFSGTIASIVDRLHALRLQIPGVYDTVRIVDPVRNISRVLYPYDQTETQNPCYKFWLQSSSCDNCIAIQAYVQNRAYYKIKTKEGCRHLVLGFPMDTGESTLVIEMIKSLEFLSESVLEQNVTIPEKDRLTGLYTRAYIEKNLPVLLRLSRIEGSPLSIIVSTLSMAEKSDNPVGMVNKYIVSDEVVAEFGSAIQKEMGDGCWTGRYAGTIFLTVMEDSNLDDANAMCGRIKSAVEKHMDQFKNGDHVKVRYGVKTITAETADVAHFIDGAFLDLRNTNR